VSVELVRLRLKQLGFKYMRGRWHHQLTPAQRAARVAFARSALDTPWDRVLYCDEATVYLGDRSRVGIWTRGGAERRCRPKARSVKVNVWGMFGINGVGHLHTFTGTMTAQRYVPTLAAGLCESRATAITGELHAVVEDNAPWHTAKVVKQYYKDSHVRRLDWPPYSPDLNPIENLWSLLKHLVQQRSPTDFESLRHAVIDAWRSVSPNVCRNLVESMNRRLSAVIELGGYYTDY